MSRIQFVIADSNIEYIERFKLYIRESEYANRLLLKSFSQEETLEQFLDENPSVQIIFAEEKFLSERVKRYPIDLILLIGEKNSESASFRSLSKYQPLNQLISQILSIYAEHRKNEWTGPNGDKNTTIISVYSAAGGTGKTVTAVNLAKQIASKGAKVFYLNLEILSSTKMFFPHTDSNDISKILYYIKSSPKQLIAKIENLKKYDPYSKVEYFDPALNLQDMSEISSEDIMVLLNALVQLRIYDYIIIDLDSSTHQRITEALKNSDVILWLLLDDIQSLHKTKWLIDFYRQLFQEKFDSFYRCIHFVLNRHLGEPLKNNPNEYGIEISYFLPYIPEWKAVRLHTELTQSEPFLEEIDRLSTSVITKMKK